jgi:hypothetical protein
MSGTEDGRAKNFPYSKVSLISYVMLFDFSKEQAGKEADRGLTHNSI